MAAKKSNQCKNMKNSTMNKTIQKAWIGLFIAAIGLPLVGSVLKWDNSSESSIIISENRLAAKLSSFQWNLQYFDQFPANFESYYNDFFGFRESLITVNNFIQVKAFGNSPSKLVILGKHPWLFFNEEGYELSEPFKEKELIEIKRRLKERKKWLDSLGIQYLFFVAPNKGSIYSEYLPEAIKHRSSYSNSNLKQLTDYFKKNSDVEIIDVRSQIYSLKRDYPLYEETDTHWNQLGAFYAYQQVMQQVVKRFPMVKPLTLLDFRIRSVKENGGDLAQVLKLKTSLYRQTSIKLERVSPSKTTNFSILKERRVGEKVALPDANPPFFNRGTALIAHAKNQKLPKVLIFGDSFAATHFKDLVKENFRETVAVAQTVLDVELIEQERPDVVIHEVVERSLIGPTPMGFFNSADLKNRPVPTRR